MKKFLSILSIVAFTFIGAQAAQAHAQISSTFPVKNKITKTAPNLIWIEFDGNLITLDGKAMNIITIFDSKNKRIDDNSNVVGGARITTHPKFPLKPGKYSVNYRVVSEDGHPVSGNYYFTYQP
jgi:hypothetical protein